MPRKSSTATAPAKTAPRAPTDSTDDAIHDHMMGIFRKVLAEGRGRPSEDSTPKKVILRGGERLRIVAFFHQTGDKRGFSVSFKGAPDALYDRAAEYFELHPPSCEHCAQPVSVSRSQSAAKITFSHDPKGKDSLHRIAKVLITVPPGLDHSPRMEIEVSVLGKTGKPIDTCAYKRTRPSRATTITSGDAVLVLEGF